MNSDVSKAIQELFLVEEAKSERYANCARLFFTVLYVVTAFGIKNELPQLSFKVVLCASFVNFVNVVFTFIYLKRKKYVWWIKYFSVGLDVLLLSIFIYTIGTYRTFKTTAFLIYYLWIGMSVIRLSPKLTVFTGILSVASYLLITVLAVSSGSIELGTITEGFTSSKVSMANILIRIIFLSAFVGVVIYIATFFHVIVNKAVRKELLEKQNKQLVTVLGRLRKTKSELAAKNRELAILSEIDSLTELYNRRKIDSLLEDSFKNYQAVPGSMAVIILDIDHFKRVNDAFGHQMGDEVIKSVANLLSSNVRTNDSVGRWGGEEFIIVCADIIDKKEIERMAERLRSIIAGNDFGIKQELTCSFGVSFLKENDSIYKLLKRADDALYQSKRDGRNRVSLSPG